MRAGSLRGWRHREGDPHHSADIKAQASSEGMVSMRRSAMLKVQQGVTTPLEVIRNVYSIM